MTLRGGYCEFSNTGFRDTIRILGSRFRFPENPSNTRTSSRERRSGNGFLVAISDETFPAITQGDECRIHHASLIPRHAALHIVLQHT